jgi:alpha-2-macroglobulin
MKSSYKHFLKGFSNLLYQLFGTFSWNSPPWLKYLLGGIHPLFQPNSWRGVAWIGGFMILLTTFTVSVYFYQHRYKPILITAQMSPPTNLRDELKIDFVKEASNTFASVAPLKQFGKVLHTGIEIDPSIQGQWRWIGDSQLIFTPATDWPAGQTYQIAFDKTVFDQNVNLKAHRYRFSTKPLGIDLYDLRLYQDLKDPNVLKIVGTLEFNFPVDRDSLLERVKFMMQEIKNDGLDISPEHIPLAITYDEFDRKAYIESAPLKLPTAPRFVNLMIDAGVKAAKGPSKSKAPITQKLLIPSFGSFLQVKAVDATIQRDNQENPEQILHLETTVGISSEELLRHLKVYVLPKDYPATPFQPIRKDYDWSKPGEVTSEVLALAKAVQLQPFAESHPFPTSHRFKLQVQTPSNLFIQIVKGLPGAGGFSLAEDYKTVLQSPDYAKKIHFLPRGSLMAKSGEKKITVSVRGIPKVKFTICQILPQNIHHLVTQTYGNFQKPQFRYGNLHHEDISQIFSEFRQFHVTDPCDLKYTSIDLEQYLAENQNSLGLFLLKAQGWDAKNNVPIDIEDDRLLLITDMALIVKDLADGTHELFVQSITEGLPVADAEVSLLGKNSLPISKATTDREGHVHFLNMQDFKDDREPSVYLVRKGNDLSFIPYERCDRVLNYSRFDTDGLITCPESLLSAYLFLDRGIYRAGDLIHIGAIVKNRFSQDPTNGLPLEIVLTDPQGATLLKQKLPLPESHLFSIDYTLPLHAPSGKYYVNLYAMKEDKVDTLLGFSSLMVGEFLPDRLKMEAHFMPETPIGWHLPFGKKATVSLWNLFGTPAANHCVKAKMILTPNGALRFPQYENYRFVDPLTKPDSKFFVTENFTDGVTDDNGNLEFNLNLERYSNATYQLDFFAEGFEGGGGRAISTKLSALVTPHMSLIGYKPHGDLSYLKQHSKESVHFIAINRELQPIALSALKAKLIEYKTVLTLVKKSDGTYQYQDELQKRVQSEHAFEIASRVVILFYLLITWEILL